MVELAHGRAGLAAVRNQILRPAPVAPKATPKGPKQKVQGSLTAISEAAEWAEESTAETSTNAAEVDAVWAEAGFGDLGDEDARPEQGSAATVKANAVAAACAARKV